MLEFIQRIKRQHRAFQHFTLREITKIPRGDIGQQRQPDVGRRGAVRDHRLWDFLEVIRRQPVFCFIHENFKEGPGLTGSLTQVNLLLCVQIRHLAAGGLTEPA